MEEKKKLLSEENYQKGKHLIGKIRVALWCIGGVLAVVGLILLIVGLTQDGGSSDPWGMSPSGGTDIGMVAGGAVCLMFGIFLLISGAMTFVISHRREMLAFGVNSVLPVADEAVDAGAPIVEKASKTIGKSLGNVVGGVKEGWTGESNTIECPECKTENSKKNKFCKNCGKALSSGSFCGKCGKKISSDSKFCPNCGEKVEE